jgi:hypothetical protein
MDIHTMGPCAVLPVYLFNLIQIYIEIKELSTADPVDKSTHRHIGLVIQTLFFCPLTMVSAMGVSTLSKFDAS